MEAFSDANQVSVSKCLNVQSDLDQKEFFEKVTLKKFSRGQNVLKN